MSEESDLTSLKVSRHGHWMSRLERHATMIADRAALVWHDETLTWAQLHGRTRTLAAAFAQRGVGFGDRVAIATGNRVEFIETMLATNLLGGIAVPLNFRLTPAELRYALEDSGALIVVSDGLTVARIDEALGTMDAAPLHVTTEGGSTRAEAYEGLMAEQHAPFEAVEVDITSPCLIMYTSGTTGRPKGAVLTHQNMSSQTSVLLQAYGGITPEDVILTASPMFHIGALGGIAPALFLGITNIILDSSAFDAGRVLGLLAEHMVSITFMVPTQWQAICAAAKANTTVLPRLRVLAWGAAPASPPLLEAMLETFPQGDPVALFGQTEMSPVTCVLEGAHARKKLGSIGRPVAQVAARIVDATMQDVPDGAVGEIVYRGTGLMQGYWNKPEETAQAFAGGWFHSGDLVYRDTDGFLYVVDRLKDMIISGGENIYCAEVENVLAGHPDIMSVTIVGRVHEVWGETPVAFVVLQPGAPKLTLEALREYAAEHLARYKLPTDLVLMDDLPRNASGKILKNTLRQQVQGGAQ